MNINEFTKRETVEFNDVMPMSDIEKILKTMERDCIENVGGELKLTVLCGEVVNATLVKTTEDFNF